MNILQVSKVSLLHLPLFIYSKNSILQRSDTTEKTVVKTVVYNIKKVVLG